MKWKRDIGKMTVALLMMGGMAAAVLPSQAVDWPKWRGPQSNGVSPESDWTTQWPRGGPRRLWTAQVGTGYSSCAVAAGKLYTMGSANGRDTLFCLNAETGKPLWTHAYPHPGRPYDFDPNPTGTGATPVVDGDKVYILSREGLAKCLNAATGKVVWERDLRAEANAQVPKWGFTASPFIFGTMAIYNVGTSGIAVAKATGRVIWKSGGGLAGYATPVGYRMGNQGGVAIFTGEGITAVNPKSGARLWSHRWDTQYGVNAADPVIANDMVFISSGYNRGGALLRIAGGRPSVLWETREMRTQINSCVLINGYIYGNDANTLKCLDSRSGRVRWQSRGMGNGGLIAADGKLIVMTERGELVVVAAVPEKYTELARAKVMNGVCWTQPALANGRLYCRNNGGDLVCLDVRGR